MSKFHCVKQRKLKISEHYNQFHSIFKDEKKNVSFLIEIIITSVIFKLINLPNEVFIFKMDVQNSMQHPEIFGVKVNGFYCISLESQETNTIYCLHFEARALFVIVLNKLSVKQEFLTNLVE